jgi:acetyl esterase/lipase
VLAQLRPTNPNVALPPDALPAGVTAHEEVIYSRPGDRPLALDLYQPPGKGRHPAVIIVHGGGWERGDRRMERPFAKRLAALGYVTVPVSYRLDVEGRFPNALLDLKAAVRWLRAQAARYAIDPARIGAVGASAGGQLVALLGAVGGEVQAVVDIDGLADFTGSALVTKETKSAGAPTRFLGGPYVERAAIWRAASALSHLGPHSAPTLFINSSATSAVPQSSGPILPGRTEMRDRLRSLGIDSAIVIVPDTQHPFWLVHPWFEPTLAETERFLRLHLR